MMKTLKCFSLSILLMLISVAYAQASVSPVPLLQNTADALIQSLQKHRSQLKANPDLVYQLVKKIVIPKVDQQRMARSVVSREDWSKATQAQRQQFIKLFRNLVIRTYASAFSEYTNERVRFRALRGMQPQQRDVQVQSAVIRPGKPSIPVTYSMVRENGQWKIYDFSVEGVSMVRSFRSQFASLSREGLPGIIKVLQNHRSKM